MYQSFFGLSHRPFDNTPDPRFYFPKADHAEALAALQYGVSQRRGVTLITGASGSGKTMVAGMLEATLAERAHIVTVSHGPENARDLFESVCRGVGVRFSHTHSTGELFDRLRSTLQASCHDNVTPVLVVENAHRLELPVLEALSVITGLENPSVKLLPIIMLSQPVITSMLCEVVLEPLRQGIYCIKHLDAMTLEETAGYLQHRIRCAGLEQAGIFTDDAVAKVHECAAGVPRSINQICDGAMVVAFGAGMKRVDHAVVTEVVEQMMTLSIPSIDARSRLVQRELIAAKVATDPLFGDSDAAGDVAIREASRMRSFESRLASIRSRARQLCGGDDDEQAESASDTMKETLVELQARMEQLRPMASVQVPVGAEAD